MLGQLEAGQTDRLAAMLLRAQLCVDEGKGSEAV